MEELTVELGSDVEELTVELGSGVEDLTIELGSDVEDLTIELGSDVEPESGLEQSAEDEAEPLDLGVHAIAMDEETPAVLELKEAPGPASASRPR